METKRVVAAIILKNDRIFATLRGYGEFVGRWEFPGGKIEEGETPEEALVREMREELDAEIEVVNFLERVEYDYPDFHLSMDCFVCKLVSEDIVLKEHEAFAWVKEEELEDMDWLPADLGLLEKIREYMLFHRTMVVLSHEQMERIAKYEITFQDVLPEDAFERVDIVCTEPCKLNLELLEIALNNIREKNPTVAELHEHWIAPIEDLNELFGLDEARWDDEDDGGWESEMDALLESEKDVFNQAWLELEMAWEYSMDEFLVSEVIDFEKLLDHFTCYYENQGRPILECIFPRETKKTYIRRFEEQEAQQQASEEELELCRRFVNELCEQDSTTALHIKGYSCYGGDLLFPCDWEVSRDCMLRLYEKTDRAMYANTLGYIYYYGRCNGGQPEYEKAFYYFTISAANGLYEGVYKLADMYQHGYGCKKSLATACRMYEMVYEDALKHFLKGDYTNFADAALRMGNVYAKGIGRLANSITAFTYYLQALYVAKLRAKESHFFGAEKVVRNVEAAIHAIKKELPEDFFEEQYEFSYPTYLEDFVENNNRCKLHRRQLDAHTWELEVERMGTQSVPEPEALLITIPNIQFCERTIRLRMVATDVQDIWFAGDSDCIRYDFLDWNFEDDRCNFFYDGELTGWIQCEDYVIVRE